MATKAKSVFLTGSTGFLGKVVAEKLLSQGYKVTALTHSQKQVPEGCQPAYADILDQEAISEFISRNDYVIHLAGIVGNQACSNDIEQAIKVNVAGSLNVFSGMAYFKVPGIYVGVGNADDNTIYAITKTTGERFAQMYNKEHGAKILQVRLFNVYGPGQTEESGKFIPKTVASAKSGNPIEVYGDGTSMMDFIHVEDAAFLLVKCLDKLTDVTATTEVVHIGTSTAVSLNEAAKIICNKSLSTSKIIHTTKRAGEKTPLVVAKKENLLNISGFVPRDLKSGIETLFIKN